MASAETNDRSAPIAKRECDCAAEDCALSLPPATPTARTVGEYSSRCGAVRACTAAYGSQERRYMFTRTTLAYLRTHARTHVGGAVERADRQVERAAREQHDELVAPDQPVQRAHLQATVSEIRSLIRGREGGSVSLRPQHSTYSLTAHLHDSAAVVQPHALRHRKAVVLCLRPRPNRPDPNPLFCQRCGGGVWA